MGDDRRSLKEATSGYRKGRILMPTINSMVDSNAEPKRALSYILEAQKMFAAEV
jgi:hypothetical protein